MRTSGTLDQVKEMVEGIKASLKTGPATGIAGPPATMGTSKTKRRDTGSTTNEGRTNVAAVKGGQARRGKSTVDIAIDHRSAAVTRTRLTGRATQAHVGINPVGTAI
jgi:hypothetical protein